MKARWQLSLQVSSVEPGNQARPSRKASKEPDELQ